MSMAAPPHPGVLLAENLAARGITQTKLAAAMRVGRVTLNLIVNGHAGLTAAMAVRLELALGTPVAQYWSQLQCVYDLHKARQDYAAVTAKVRPLP